MEQDAYNRLTELTAKVQDAIFQTPDIALGVGGWHLRHGKRGPMKCTNQRPDGSVTRRKTKMALYFKPEGYLYLSYNGSSFKSGAIWTILKERYHEDNFVRLVRLLCDEYHIFCDLDDQTATTHLQPRKKAFKMNPATKTTTTTPAPIGDEKDAAIIPDSIVSRYLDLTREDQLRAYLNDILDPLVLEGVWNDYQVGVAQDGRPVFFYFDRAGRCRNGKIMRFTPDGHRDRETDGSILSVPYLLKRKHIFPEDLNFDTILYGEHLLTRYTDKPIALVESEKSALICTAVNPEFVWLATGGVSYNMDRAVALLSGRGVRVFPDADAFDAWSKVFTRKDGFVVSDFTARLAAERGQAWAKCDLADFILEQQKQI